MLKLNFQVRAPKFQEATKDYIQEKLSKLEKVIKKYEEITIKIDQINSSVGSFLEFKLEVTIKMPHAFLKVQGHGSNINSLIDKLVSPLKKKLARYYHHEDRWTEHTQWKANQYIPDTEDAEDLSSIVNNYEPIIVNKDYDDDTPLHPAQAVEKMELLGHNAYLFKNIENNRYAMVYKLKKTGYALVQPKV